MTGFHITDADRYACALRELERRRRDYPVRIANHRLTRDRARWEYAVMASIVQDYAERVLDREVLERLP